MGRALGRTSARQGLVAIACGGRLSQPLGAHPFHLCWQIGRQVESRRMFSLAMGVWCTQPVCGGGTCTEY